MWNKFGNLRSNSLERNRKYSVIRGFMKTINQSIVCPNYRWSFVWWVFATFNIFIRCEFIKVKDSFSWTESTEQQKENFIRKKSHSTFIVERRQISFESVAAFSSGDTLIHNICITSWNIFQILSTDTFDHNCTLRPTKEPQKPFVLQRPQHPSLILLPEWLLCIIRILSWCCSILLVVLVCVWMFHKRRTWPSFGRTLSGLEDEAQISADEMANKANDSQIIIIVLWWGTGHQWKLSLWNQMN